LTPPGAPNPGPLPVSVVIITRDRCAGLLESLPHIVGSGAGDRAAPEVIVVDNGSSDGTVAAVRRLFPEVIVVEAGRNAGAAGRNLGVARARPESRLIAFADDDSWWADGALSRAVRLFDEYPRLGLLAGRVLVGPDQRLDPTCEAMAASPLPAEGDLPGPSVLGFLACGAVVRRLAFEDAGGFTERFGVGGEETLLAVDLASAGWGLAYCPAVVAHHHPSPVRAVHARRRRQARNQLWSAWLRMPALDAAAESLGMLRAGWRDPDTWRGCALALMDLPWVLRTRRVAPAAVAANWRLLRATAPPA
jgi:GT2 family glycosyltransferase